MPIEATSPTEITAVYDKWAFTFCTNGIPLAEPGGNEVGKVSCTVVLFKYRTREDGIDERSPLPGDIRTITIEDVYEAMKTKPLIAKAFSAIMEAVESEADEQGAR